MFSKAAHISSTVKLNNYEPTSNSNSSIIVFKSNMNKEKRNNNNPKLLNITMNILLDKLQLFSIDCFMSSCYVVQYIAYTYDII